jgi:hypothetical protein
MFFFCQAVPSPWSVLLEKTSGLLQVYFKTFFLSYSILAPSWRAQWVEISGRSQRLHSRTAVPQGRGLGRASFQRFKQIMSSEEDRCAGREAC